MSNTVYENTILMCNDLMCLLINICVWYYINDINTAIYQIPTNILPIINLLCVCVSM